MEINLYSKTTKKIIFIGFLLLIEVVCLYFYYINQDFIANMKLDYVTKVYYPVYAQKFLDLKNDFISSAFSVFAKDDKKGSFNQNIVQRHTKSVPVLLYHGVVSNFDDANVQIDDFRHQMMSLKENGWQTIGLEDFYKFKKGEISLPQKSFLLTFDDGRKDTYYPVDPILEALNFKATIFIITKHVEEENNNFYLSKNEIKKMLHSGRWNVEVHTKDGHDFYDIDAQGTKGHFFTNKLWLKDQNRLETEDEFEERIYLDLVSAKKYLESEFGIKVNGFAFPFGDYYERTLNFTDKEYLKNLIIKQVEKVYPLAFYQVTPGLNLICNYPEASILVKRINVRPEWTPENILAVLNASQDKKLPYVTDFSKYDSWVKLWGRYSIEDNSRYPIGDNSMVLRSSGSGTSNAVFLEGSNLWTNYLMKTKIEWVKGENLSILVRFQDERNYIAVIFLNQGLKIEQSINGQKIILAEFAGNFRFSGKEKEVWVEAKDSQIKIFLGGNLVLMAKISDSRLMYGGIGFIASDSVSGNSEIIIKNVDVEISN